MSSGRSTMTTASSIAGGHRSSGRSKSRTPSPERFFKSSPTRWAAAASSIAATPPRTSGSHPQPDLLEDCRICPAPPARSQRPRHRVHQVAANPIVFSEVITLSETEYDERPIARLDPGWVKGNLGTHTTPALASLRLSMATSRQRFRPQSHPASTLKRKGDNAD
jgi:hypothetical protein